MRSLMELFQGSQGVSQRVGGDDPPLCAPVPSPGTAERFGARVIFSSQPPTSGFRRRRFVVLFGFVSLIAGGGWLSSRLDNAEAHPPELKHVPLPVVPLSEGAEVALVPAPKSLPPRPHDDGAATDVARRLEVIPMPEGSDFLVTRHVAPTPDPRLSAAWMALLHGDPVAAIGGYEEVLAESPENRQALLGVAAVEVRRGESAQARRAYLRLLQRDPADPLALAGLLELEPAGDSTARERRLKQLLARHPDIAPLHSVIGSLYAGQERWSDAERAYAQARTIEQQAGMIDPQTSFNLAVALDHLGQKEEARARYEEALIGAQPGNPSFDTGAAQARVRALSEI